MRRSRHVLKPATSLLGISLLIIAGLHIANDAGKTFADEIAWVGVICFAASCVLSYLSLRDEDIFSRYERLADRVFLIGTGTLLISVVVLAISDF
jgi:hypothetical protein